MKEEQIVKAAKELFSKYGFKKVSMDEIAYTAGVTKKTVYTYFSSKEELLKFLIEQEIKNMRKIVDKVEDEDSEFFESVHKGIYNLLKYRKKSNFLNVLFKEAEFLRNTTLAENLLAIEDAIKNYIKEKLEYASSKKYIVVQDIDIMAFIIYKMYIALFIEWSEGSKIHDEEKIADSILQVFKNGLKRKEVEESD